MGLAFLKGLPLTGPALLLAFIIVGLRLGESGCSGREGGFRVGSEESHIGMDVSLVGLGRFLIAKARVKIELEIN